MNEASSNAPQATAERTVSHQPTTINHPDSSDAFASEAGKADRRKLRRIIAAATIVLLPLVYFFPAVIGKITLVPGDGLTQNLGVRVLIGQMLRDGQLPLWNPYIFAGTPLLASIYPGALYPPNWLFALFSPATAMNIVVITTYHLTMIGCYLYARRIGMTRAGAVITGVAFAFGGYMMAHLGHTSRIAAAAWLPWILLAIEHLYLRATWRWIALGAAFIALQLFAGEPQMNFYTVLVCGAYLLFSLTLREERERRGRLFLGAAAMSVCGLLLSMIQLLPERELLKLGERASISYDYFAGYSFPPGSVFTFIFPFFFGGGMIQPYKVEYWGGSTIDEACGYFGLLALLLGIIALFGSTRRSLTAFWGAVALVSLLLAFNGYLPFDLGRALWQTPVYSLFRAQGRHLFEFTFAAAMLAGLGASFIAQAERERVRRAVRLGAIVFVVIVAITIVVYRFFGSHLTEGLPRPDGAGSLANAEALVPLAFAAASLIALLIYARWRNAVGAALLIAVIFVDLATFALGFNYGWRDFVTGADARLQDPPAVQFIKSRETDLNSFRVVSYSQKPFDDSYDALNFPNVSIARGLQSVNGYDALRLPRPGAIAGGMNIEGLISEVNAFGSEHQGFNLLNVKYLLRERPSAKDPANIVEIAGIGFDRELINTDLIPGSRLELATDQALASELAIVSTMAHAVHVPDDTPVAKLMIHAKDGRVMEREIRIGRDSAEWAYDRDDVRADIQHRRPQIAESWPAEGFQAHRYLARIPFDRAEVTRIEINYALPDASLLILRASLFDGETGVSTPLNLMNLHSRRWRRQAEFGDVEVYENTEHLPRAWFVRRAAVQMSDEVLQTIKTGRLKDGSPFDPSETALFEKEDFGHREIVLPQIGEPTNAEVSVTRYEPQRIELQTRNAQPGFLVLSEIYYRGWEAWIDGRRAPIEKVNYALRGLSVPAGDHRVEFVFRAHSFRNGAVYTLLGLLLLLVGAGGSRLGAGPMLARVGSRLKQPVARFLTSVWSLLRRVNVSRCLGVAAVIGLLIYGYLLVRYASYAVGGSDSSGYARIAQSLLKGSLVQPVAELDKLGVPVGVIHCFVPLGYDLGPRPGTMTPFYPVGLPLHIAAAALIAGWNYGPFLVSPSAALLSLILIYLVGLELGLSRGFAIAGAMILAANPTFLFMALSPMSDVAATLWSLVAIWASLRSSKRDGWAALAGAAFGMAFLVRPVSLLLLIPLLFSLRLKPKTILCFVLGGLPLAAIFFAYNFTAYGHPLRTGYALIGLHTALTTAGFGVRFSHYAYWLAMTLSPLVLLGWLGVAANWRVHWRVRALLIAWFGAFLIFYACYDVYEAWWYTRFLLPAYPAIILGALLTARDVVDVLKARIAKHYRAAFGAAASIILLAAPLGFEQRHIRRFNVTGIGVEESVIPASCRWADQTLPTEALVLSMQMSGALKFYTQRPIVRWDLAAPPEWQLLKDRAVERGYKWYALLLPFEVEEAQKRLTGKWVQIGTFRTLSLWRIET